MAEYMTLARPYAIALFELAKPRSEDLHAWEQVLSVLSSAWSDKQLSSLMGDPRLSAQQRQTLLNDLLATLAVSAVQRLGEALPRFISLLIEYHRLPALSDILTLYQELVAKAQNTLPVEVCAAFALDPAQQEALTAALSQRFQRQIVPTFIIDKGLMGGLSIRTPTRVMDASIRGKLATLQHSLIG